MKLVLNKIFSLALVLNLLKNFFERSRISFSPSFYFIPNRGPHWKELKMGLNKLRTSGGITFVLIIFGTSSFIYPFSYDSAVHKAQKGNWQDAYGALNNLITNNPDSADVMYDAGVAASHIPNYKQAATCFIRAAECAKDKEIAFRSHFNAGNALVEQKDLNAALDQYNKALALEPTNEYARHNRDRVEEMLKQEKNKQDKKDNKDKKDEQKEEDKKDDTKDDQKNGDDNKQDNKQEQQGNDQQSSDGNDKGDGNDQQSDQSQNDQKKDSGNQSKKSSQKNETSDDKNGEQSDEQSQADQGNNAQDKSNTTEGKEQRDKNQQQKNAANDQKRDGKDKLDKQSQQAQHNSEKQQRDKHGHAPEKHDMINDQNNQFAQDIQASEQAINDPWLVSVLNNQEMQDKAVNKQLMEAKIRQHGGKNGQNCW